MTRSPRAVVAERRPALFVGCAGWSTPSALVGIFDNTALGHAVANALDLTERIG